MKFRTSDRLTAFLYLLLRDHITFGELEKLIVDTKPKPCWDLSEYRQAEYAAKIAKELKL
jgi:hypothetical protein